MRILVWVLFSGLLLVHALVNAGPPSSDSPGKSGSAPGHTFSHKNEPGPVADRPPAHGVPEPSTLLLLTSGIIAFGGYQYARFRRNKKQ